MKPAGTLFLKRSEVEKLLQPADYVTLVEAAFRAHAEGRSMSPGLLHSDAVGGEFHIKAGGLLTDPPHFGVKVNGGFFKNRENFGMPNIQGVILLSDAATGYPLCVMDSVAVTIQRTAAATVAAARRLARPASAVCTLCGLGTQGRVQLAGIAAALPIRKVFAWSNLAGEPEEFSSRASRELGLAVSPAGDLDAAVLQSDVVVTCTPSRKAFLLKKSVRPGTFIAAIGADSPEKQELEATLVASSKVVGDILEQIVEVGETHHAIQGGLMRREDVYAELGEIIAGRKPGRTSDQEIIVYDATGTALQDVASAVELYRAALKAGLGTLVDLAS